MAKQKHIKRKLKNKNKQQKFWQRIIVIVVVFLLGIGVGCLVFWVVNQNSSDPIVNDDQQQVELEVDNNDNNEQLSEEEPPAKVSQYEGENPNYAESLTGAITVKYIRYDILNIAAYSDQDILSGTCVAQLIDSYDDVVREVEVGLNLEVSNAVCEPIQINVAGLSGKYKIRIQLTGENKTGTIEDEIEI